MTENEAGLIYGLNRHFPTPLDKQKWIDKFNGKQENSNAFWYYFFRQTSVKDLLISISKGTAQLNLSPVETKSLKFILPKSINENLLAAFDKIFNYEVSCSIESNELIALRDTLLPKLISGELEINELPN